MSDIVERLRVYGGGNHRIEAADEIERLRKDNTDLQNKVVAPLRERVAELEADARRLEDALREYIDAADESVTGADDVAAMLRFGDADRAARAALKEKT